MMMSFREMKKNDLDEFLEKNKLFFERTDAKNSFCCKFQVPKIDTTNNNTLVITAQKNCIKHKTEEFTMSKKNDSYYDMKFDDIAHIPRVRNNILYSRREFQLRCV
mmetsp:Transcript_44818/g.50610  ORF Transcript_44818/g.50610 Transcript_44818/m.50610 type:complete len:106 (-) Transcript_44818:250-567(-)